MERRILIWVHSSSVVMSIVQKIIEMDMKHLAETLRGNKVPSVAIAAFSEHSQLFTCITQDNYEPIDQNTSFRVCSLNKPVFAYLVHLLHQEGSIGLDTPLSEYWEQPYIDHKYIGLLTPRLILSHQTGFPNWAHREPLDFEFRPGDRFQYSGEGYVYLQHTVERIKDQSSQELLKEYVFDPLGMNRSALHQDYLHSSLRTQGYDEAGVEITDRKEATPDIIDYLNRMPRHGNVAGTMWASIADYTGFLSYLITSEDETTRKIRQNMLSPQVQIEDWDCQWGVGIGLDIIDDRLVSWHWGSDNGFKTFMIAFPSSKEGVTIFTNGNNGKSIYRYVLSKILPSFPGNLKIED